jgi:hypothetical protein
VDADKKALDSLEPKVTTAAAPLGCQAIRIFHSGFKWHSGVRTAKDHGLERRAHRKQRQRNTLYLKVYPVSGLSQSALNEIVALAPLAMLIWPRSAGSKRCTEVELSRQVARLYY